MENFVLRQVCVIVIALLTLGLNAAHGAGKFGKEMMDLEALAKLKSVPTMRLADGFESTENLKAIYFDALEWKGRETKVFAWLGLPEHLESKVPGIVLVHGGGGTAFKEWVKKWNERGYAAISIAVEGQTDVKNPEADRHMPWMTHVWPGPRRSGIYGDSDEALKDQWMYHATANTILANSFLRALPEVDESQVGIMGVSWGGVITATTLGLDDRFAFAIPTYGCGDLATSENVYGRALGNNALYRQVWDPILRLKQSSTPALWFSWPGEGHFALDLQANCYKAQSGPYMVSLVPGMHHGHGPAWNRPESYAFADSIVQSGSIWCQQVSLHVEDSAAKVVFQSSKELGTAELISTMDTGFTGSREWIQTPLAKPIKMGDHWTVEAIVPEGSTAWFINVKSGNLIVSSDFTPIYTR